MKATPITLKSRLKWVLQTNIEDCVIKFHFGVEILDRNSSLGLVFLLCNRSVSLKTVCKSTHLIVAQHFLSIFFNWGNELHCEQIDHPFWWFSPLKKKAQNVSGTVWCAQRKAWKGMNKNFIAFASPKKANKIWIFSQTQRKWSEREMCNSSHVYRYKVAKWKTQHFINHRLHSVSRALSCSAPLASAVALRFRCIPFCTKWKQLHHESNE